MFSTNRSVVVAQIHYAAGLFANESPNVRDCGFERPGWSVSDMSMHTRERLQHQSVHGVCSSKAEAVLCPKPIDRNTNIGDLGLVGIVRMFVVVDIDVDVDVWRNGCVLATSSGVATPLVSFVQMR